MQSTRKYYAFALILTFICLQAYGQDRFIKTVEPSLGYGGQMINIKGSGFAAGDRVFFGSVEGNVISISDQLMEVEVPSGATFDNISVLNTGANLIFYANKKFLLSYGGSSGVAATDFDSQVDIFAENGLYDVCVCDLDGDLKNDIIGANSKTTRATILSNLSTPGNISIGKTPINLGANTLNTTCGDLTGDGKPEIIFTEASNGSRLFVLVNFSTPGTLSFTLQAINIPGASTKRVVANDLDRDGKPDLIVTDQSANKVYLVKNTSAGGLLSFDSNITTLTVQNAVSTAGLEVQDLNRDKRPEIIVNQFLTDGGGFYIATNHSTKGNFSFSDFSQVDSPGTFVNMKVADLNGDDKPDIVATLFLSASVAVFLNQTANTGDNPTFASAQNLNTDQRPWGLDFGDLDGDMKKDIIVSTVGADLSVNVLNNTMVSNTLDFQKVPLPVTFINRNIKVADIDGDSKPDIVFTSVDDESQGISSSKISILRNNRCIIPVISPEGPLTVCSGNTPHLETQLVQGATYEWRKDGALEKTGPDNFLDVSTSGGYTVTTITEGGACSETSETVTVTIQAAGALPSPNIATNAPVCTGGALTLTADNVGATTYAWRGPAGFSQTGLSVNISNFKFENTGRYYLDVYSGSCIIETKSTVVDIITSPEFFVERSGNGTYCPGDPVTLTISPNAPGFTYQWFDDSGAISGATGSSFSPTASGSYYAEAIDQINVSCPSIPTNVIAVDFLEAPQAQFSFPTGTCSNSSVPFTDASTVDSNAQVSYLWDFGDGLTSTSQNPSHTYPAANNYDVTLTVSYDGLTCSDQIVKEITIEGNLDIQISAPSNSFCEGDSLVLSTDNSFSTYTWNTGATASSITVAESGTYSVTVTDNNGCEGTDDLTVEALATPEIEISSSKNNIAPGDTITLTASGLANYAWSPDSVLSDPGSAETNATLFSTTLFTVSGEGANGCPGMEQLEIIVLQNQIGSLLEPKKFFSPNNDAMNEYWEVKQIDQFDQCGVEIYDQEGNRIYESKPYLNDWDGKSKGKEVPDGVYYYIIRCDDLGIVRSGSITLLR